jgi:nitroreductase
MIQIKMFDECRADAVGGAARHDYSRCIDLAQEWHRRRARLTLQWSDYSRKEYLMDKHRTPPPALPLIGPTALLLDADVSPDTATLLDLLRRRRSTREFDTRGLPAYLLSRLLWAAWGINRVDSGRRTAPSSRDRQTVEIYVAMVDGAFRFDARRLLLEPVSGEDLRAATGVQDCAAIAPVDLVYVARLDAGAAESLAEQKFYAAIDTGFISQNVYLLCAAEGLATVVRGALDRPALAAALGLGAAQRVIVAQSVGYPAVPAEHCAVQSPTQEEI